VFGVADDTGVDSVDGVDGVDDVDGVDGVDEVSKSPLPHARPV